MDPYSQARIVGLHPEMVKRYASLDLQLEAQGIVTRITCGNRSMAEQAADYAQGRTTPGSVITNAQPGESWHQYGFAMDLVPLMNGEPDWNVEGANWQAIYRVAATLNLRSGASFAIRDNDHFQLQEVPESPTADDIALLQSQGMAAVWQKYFPIATDVEID